MFKELRQRLMGHGEVLFEPHVPEVEECASVSDVFDKARAAARGDAGENGSARRHLVIVTPGRLLMLQPCPVPGSMPEAEIAPIQKMISPARQRNIVAI